MGLTLSEVCEILEAEVFVGKEKMDRPLEAGFAADLMSDLLHLPTSGALLLSGLNNIQVLKSSVISGVGGVVLVRGKRPSKELIEEAEKHGLPLLATTFTMFTSCGRLFREGLRGVEDRL